MSHNDVTPGDGRPATRRWRTAAAATGAGLSSALRAQSRGGADTHVLTPEGMPSGRSVDELAALASRGARLPRESEGLREELHRDTERRAALIRGFTHDVKNPLAAADASLNLIEDGIVLASSPLGRESITCARRSIDSALALVDDLLAIVQADTGRIEVHDALVDVGRIAREAAQEYRAHGQANAVDLRLAPYRPLPIVRTDPARVRQILGNLIANAYKYTEHGSVEVSVEVSVEGAGRGPGGEAGRWIAVHVSDSGPGIPVARLTEVFREYSRLGSEKPGTGIGLAVSKRLAEALGGVITVESEMGEGTTFTLWLPLTRKD